MAPMQQKSLKKWSFHLRYSAVEEWVARNVISSHLRLEEKDKLGGTTGACIALVP
jgi:hypothetical protein